MVSVKAKFRCVSVAHLEHGKKVDFMAVMGDSEENRSFNDYTPSGSLSVHIAPGKPAGEYFEPGEEYYLEISKATKH